ncbi:patatin-like protein [Phycicoccus sonneratiae]|uniref:Patatin-like protein n=1 Tax=Phycicoccus sonneratiae TaxID=2807628 RepID=A0ABS2CG99_9MICO|nr:patatin-like protein [Phycicoccus sonneraticus]MBM6398894.1 patatin-like protein [Phycicoccus sonneraticus]
MALPTAATTDPSAAPARGLRAAALDLVPPEELRLAVVLNGGVSLAVWMGGSVLEIDRLAHAGRRGNATYATMLALAGCRARVDVVTGTSAGGINGAALALAQVNPDADLALLREVWAEQGRFETLLRSPVKGSPASLFKGDEHFLPELHAALARLARTSDPRRLATPDEAPLDLTIMTTVLRGTETVTVDALGQRLPQAVHGASFGWSRVPRRPGEATAPADDPFSPARIAATAAQMALAARASSSFPVAFEPTFVPVGAPAAHEDDPRAALWPDMAGAASWAEDGADRSRFVVDGGVLANTPTRAAMRGIMAMPAHGAVRRVLLLVYPHAPSPQEAPPDTAAAAPALTRTLAGVAGALSAQGSRTFVDEIGAFNAAATSRRGTRVDILGQLAVDGVARRRTLPVLAEDLAGRLFEHYRSARRTRAARSVAAKVVENLPSRAWCDDEEAWDLERVRRAAERAHTEGLPGPDSAPGWLPYLPTRSPGRGAPVGGDGWAWGDGGALGVVEAVNDVLRTLAWVVPGTESSACAAIGEARLAATAAVDTLAAVRGTIDERWSDPLLRTVRPDDSYWRLRLAAYAVRMTGTSRDAAESAAERVVATDRARVVEATGDDAAADLRAEALREAIGRALDAGPVPGRPATRRTSSCTDEDAQPGACGREVGGVVRGVVEALRLSALPVLVAWCREHPLDGSAAGGVLGGLEELHRWHDLLTPGGVVPRDTGALLTRLLHLEVLSTVLGDGTPTGLSIPVELVQLSAQTQNPSTEFSRTADDKLGGWSLNRFGGFLKRSWRVNDWTWGRVDAATVLARTVLCPARVRRAAHLSGYLATGSPDVLARETLDDLVGTLLAGTGLEEDPRVRALRRRAFRELHEAFRSDVAAESLPSTMPGLAGLFAWALHLELVGPELAALVAAVREDEVDGASPRSRGAVLLATEQHLLAGLGGVRDPEDVTPRDRVRALEAFDRAGVGREPLTTEMASDLLIRSAATAGAVTASVLDAPSSGLDRVRPVTRVLRGAMLAVHWLVVGLTSRATVPRSLALLGLSFGGVLLVASLFGVLPQAWSAPAALLGIGALLAAFGYGALRTGTVLHGVVLLSPLVPLVTFALTPEDAVPGEAGAAQAAASAVSATRGGVTLAAVLGVVLGLYLLGSLPQSFGSPWLLLGRLADDEGVRLPERPPRTALGRLGSGGRRRLVAVLRRLPSVLGPVLVVALPVALAAWVAATGAEGIARAVLAHRGWLVLAAVLAVLLGVAMTFRFGDLLRPLARVAREDGASDWRFGALVSPVQVTASWSVLYGLGYLVLGLVVAWRWLEPTSPPWLVALCVSALGLGLVLALGLPAVSPLLALRALERAEHRRDPEVRRFVVHDPVAAGGRPADVVARWTAHRSYAVDLAERGVGYRWLVGDGAGPDGVAPCLRPRGVELLRRLDEGGGPVTWRRRLRRVAWRPVAWWVRRRER